jgi:glucose-6-phosphate 1-dehydrogenase
MAGTTQENPVIFLLFGAAGDLSHRLILPALYTLYQHDQLPPCFSLLGTDRMDLTVEQLAAGYRDSFKLSGSPLQDDKWQAFAGRIRYVPGDLSDKRLYTQLKHQIRTIEQDWNTRAEHVFYLAIPPQTISTIATGLATAGLHRDRERSRIVVEKTVETRPRIIPGNQLRVDPSFPRGTDLSNRSFSRQGNSTEYPGIAFCKPDL